MTFTPEQQEYLNGLFGKVVEDMNKMFNGFAKRLVTEEIPKTVADRISFINEKLEALQSGGLNKDELGSVVKAQFDTLLEELAKQETETKQAQGQVQDSANNEAIEELKAQLEDLRKQAEAAKKMAAEERKVRETLAEQNRVASLDSTLIDAMRGKVKAGTEKELLTLMKAANLFAEDKESNRYVIEQKDEYGLTTRRPATDLIGDLITDRWSHYLDVRGGTGVGAAPTGSQSASPTPQNLQYFKSGDRGLVIDDNTLAGLSSAEDIDKVLTELDTITRG